MIIFSIYHYLVALPILLIGLIHLPKLKKDKLFRKLVKGRIYLFIFPVLDIISTFMFIRKLKMLEAEANPLARFFLANFGNLGYFLLLILDWFGFLLAFSFLYFAGCIAYKKYKKKIKEKKEEYLNIVFKIVSVTISVAYCFVLINNLSGILW